jgi:hypothetical protein
MLFHQQRSPEPKMDGRGNLIVGVVDGRVVVGEETSMAVSTAKLVCG